ncbi:MAG: hypothetical protein O2807_01775 [bacterium]|nr:hypothetical protein [bacterium]
MKVEPVLAKLNELRQDADLESGELEDLSIYHAFCFISYEIGPFTDFIEQGKEPTPRKDTEAGPRAREMFSAVKGMRGEVAGDAQDMEYIALDRAVAFLSPILGDFQAYLVEAGAA